MFEAALVVEAVPPMPRQHLRIAAPAHRQEVAEDAPAPRLELWAVPLPRPCRLSTLRLCVA